MKLYLQQDTCPWQTQRYHYAAEQMMLTLFPGEKPEYPQPIPRTLDRQDRAAHFALERRGDTALFTAQVAWDGALECSSYAFPAQALDGPAQGVYHAIQHGLKMAFYQAGVKVLGSQPPWGALTGVRPVKLPTRSLRQGASAIQAKQELERAYCVSPVRAQLALDCAQACLAVERTLQPNQVSLYVGIPFCPTRCAYCSFVSADVGRTLKLVEPYLQALYQEIDETARVLNQAGLHIRSFYMGGGTPTVLSAAQLDGVLTKCYQTLPLAGCTEYTVEAGRPDTITREKLQVLADQGIDRISINPQTLENLVLEAIGRKHSAQDILDAVALARQVGFACINMDLIAGLPRDSHQGFCRTLDGVLALEPENITIHTLAMKKGSTLMERGGAIPHGEEVAQMLEHSLARLRGAGYAPYYLYRQKYMSGALENVGWAKAGQDSLYNIVMMEELHTVVSVGGGGVTKLVDAVGGRLDRLPNPKYPHDYLATLDKVLAQKQEILSFYQGLSG